MHLSLPRPPPLPLLHIPLTYHTLCTSPTPRTPTRSIHPHLSIPSNRRRSSTSIPPLTSLQIIHILLLPRQRLKSRLLALGNQQTRQHTQEHEQREDLHHAMNPRRRILVCSALFYHRREEDLRKHRAEFTQSGAESVACGTYARGEDFRGCDERSRIRSKVEEELRKYIKHE